MGPQLSIIVISKNEIGFVNDFFDDIDRQTIRSQCEVVACDSSDDGTEKVVERRADCAIFTKPGLSRQLNEGLAQARSGVVLIMAMDIRTTSRDTLERALDNFNKNNYDFATLRFRNLLEPEDIYAVQKMLLGDWAWSYGAFCMMRRSVIERLGGFSEEWSGMEDTEMFFRVMANAKRCGLRMGTHEVQVRHLRLGTDNLAFRIARLFNPSATIEQFRKAVAGT